MMDESAKRALHDEMMKAFEAPLRILVRSAVPRSRVPDLEQDVRLEFLRRDSILLGLRAAIGFTVYLGWLAQSWVAFGWFMAAAALIAALGRRFSYRPRVNELEQMIADIDCEIAELDVKLS